MGRGILDTALDPDLLGALSFLLPLVPTPSFVPGGAEIVAGALTHVEAIAELPAACPDDMTLVDGNFCPSLSYTCLRPVDEASHVRCAEYGKDVSCRTKTVPRRACIDKHEWPNRVGENPMVYVSYRDAGRLCGEVGKRLCRRSEWMLACEGPKRLPYPWGFSRQPSPCNVDRAAIEFDVWALKNPATREQELGRLWQADPIGSHPGCVSPFGAFDMAGNVDEWTDDGADDPHSPHPATLNGGYWGPVRDTCRLTTTSHGPIFEFYQVGFRCCADPRDGIEVDAPEVTITDDLTCRTRPVRRSIGLAVVALGALVARPWGPDAEADEAVCPSGMVLVAGDYCPYAGHRCLEWIQQTHDRCAKYAPPPLCDGKKQKKRFCIDEYEYPNLPEVTPVIMVDYLEAEAACATEGKRLCTSSEWTLACEGQEILPYPYGYERDPKACNIDRPRPSPEPDFEAFSHPRRIAAEVDRLDLRVPSGSMSGCVSPFGVHDMTGNVDEWVENDRHFEPFPDPEDRPYVSGLKGGYWGPIRSRCRPITEQHNQWFRFYQVGFRCCADPSDGPRTKKRVPYPVHHARPVP